MTNPLASIVIGAGPAGLGPLVCAMQHNEHIELLNQGVAWIEAQSSIGSGSLGDHAISSDTSASVLLECLEGANNPLSILTNSPEAEAVRLYGSGSIPLQVGGRFLNAMGQVMENAIRTHPRSELLLKQRAARIVVRDTNDFIVELADGTTRSSRSVVFAMGGYQERDETLSRFVKPELQLHDTYAEKCILTSELFSHDGLQTVMARLKQATRPRVVLIGSSHSALTAAHLLLEAGLDFDKQAVSVMYKRPPRVFYPDQASAYADGYQEFGEADICPTTGRIYRLAGLRMAARELLRRTLGLGDTQREDRLELCSLSDMTVDDVRARLDRATVIVPAFGYRPRTLPVFTAQGKRIQLLTETGPRQPMVDNNCRILAADGTHLPGMYGIGLASGFVPRGPKLGGEPSFDGQTNGLWLYQNGIGRIVLDHMLRHT